MSIFTTHPDISSLNFHTDFQLENVYLDIFCFDFWLDIQDFIFGLGMSIFPTHHEREKSKQPKNAKPLEIVSRSKMMNKIS